MEIVKYELYHIGMKLKPNVNLTTLRQKLLENLKKFSYEINENRPSSEGIISIGIGSGKETIAKKDEVNIDINYIAGALNVNGNDSEKVYQNFVELLKIVSDIPEYEIDVIIDFYEVIANIVVSNGKKPEDILKDSVKVNFNSLSSFGNVGVGGIILRARENIANNESFDISLEPHPTSPNKFLIAKVVRQTRDRDSLKDFNKTLEKSIKELIK